MFKTRNNKAVITPHSFIIGENYSPEINKRNIEWLEECYSGETDIKAIYLRMKAANYFTNPPSGFSLKNTIDLVEDEDEPNPEFMVTGPAILLYYQMIENKSNLSYVSLSSIEIIGSHFFAKKLASFLIRM